MNAINYQVAIRGRGLRALSHAAMSELVERVIDGREPPSGIKVDIQVWARGHSIDWQAENHRAEILRETLRRLLHQGRLPFSLRTD